jgi:putative FmdB family regulatory protein
MRSKMPIYEYRCPKCSKVHELRQNLYDTDARKCPECSEPMQKPISKSSFQLKVGGWYADGYCRKTEEKGPETKPADAVNCSKAVNNKAIL